MKNTISFWVSLSLLIFFSFMFFSTTKIGEATYFGLVALSLFVGFVIHFRKNISEIDLKNMKVILQKTQKVKNEIDGIGLNLAKIIANLSTYSSGSWLNRKKLNDQIEDLLATLSVTSSEKQKILDLPRAVEKMMKDKDALTPTEKKKIDEMFSLEEKP